MTGIVQVPLEARSLIAKAPDGTLVNLRATEDGVLHTVDPLNTPDFSAGYTYTYDGNGRLASEARTVNSQTTNIMYSYDPTTGALLSQITDIYPTVTQVEDSLRSVKVFGRSQTSVANGTTTPSASPGGRLVISNSSPTSITNFLNRVWPTQELVLMFTTGNTTLVHSGNIQLKGGINVVVPNGGILVITRGYDDTGWIEMSRNF